MLWHLYLKKGTAYVPAVGQAEAGFYTEIEPVSVVPVTDSGALQSAIKNAISKGNPIVPTPPRAEKPVVLKYANVKSWSAFEKDTLTWKIFEKAGRYEIKPGRRHPDGGWEDDLNRIESLPAGATLDDVAGRVAALLVEAAASAS